MNRKIDIDVIKLILAVLIALSHWGIAIVNAGVIVNIFFFISGYYLFKSFESNKYHESFEYTKHRISRIYQYYFTALIILIIYSLLMSLVHSNFSDIFEQNVLQRVYEFFFLQNTGIFKGGINYPLWQLSCLIMASHILFGLLKFNKNLTSNVICPLLALSICTYFANIFGTHEIDFWGNGLNCFSMPLLRAIGFLSLGISFYDFINYETNYLNNNVSSLTVSIF